MTDLLIVGGGAAGLAAAVTARALGDRVQVLERMDRVGKKLLATGNGRCNLMNVGPLSYPGGETFARHVLTNVPPQAQKCFWRYLGLFLREEEGGRVYPVTGQASTVLDVLRFHLEDAGRTGNAGGCISTGVHVRSIRPHQGVWEATDGHTIWQGKRILICGGGACQPKLGSDGSCVRMLEQMGYASSPLRPALTQLETQLDPIRGLEGIRVRAIVRAVHSGTVLHEERGEVLFTAYGLSGVCVMQLSRYVDRIDDAWLSLDLTASFGLDTASLRYELSRRLQRVMETEAKVIPERFLSGLLVPRLAQAAFRLAWPGRRGIEYLSERDIDRLVWVMTDFRVPVLRLKGMDSAQITRGGIRTEAFSPDTMESVRDRGLYAAGEVLDVDGDCGGFNLMFAFAGGILAGKNGRKAPWEDRS